MKSLLMLDTKLHCRTAFISDLHLGFPGCSAELLADFLNRIECETLYLVGDIFDFWYMRRRRYWPKSHSKVLRRLLDMARNGTRVVFVPGNHDEAVRPFDGMVFGQIEVRDKVIHEAADGRVYLVLHGDQFDSVVRCSPWLARLGCVAYGLLLRMNILLDKLRKLFGLGYWSLAAFLKHKVKNAVNYISSFEQAVVEEAVSHGVDGVICGHIHHAEMCHMDEVLYMNCGDWVESCTALLERPDGTMELVQWHDSATRLKINRNDPQRELWKDLAA